jgi:hypothetical protein
MAYRPPGRSYGLDRAILCARLRMPTTRGTALTALRGTDGFLDTAGSVLDADGGLVFSAD